MAQEVEHVLGKDEVAGSNPAISSTKYHHIWWYFSIFSPKYGIFETFLATSRKKSRYNCIRIADFFGQKIRRFYRQGYSLTVYPLKLPKTP